VSPPVVDSDTVHEKRGVSIRSARASTVGVAGLTATAGELWALMVPGPSSLTTLLGEGRRRAGRDCAPNSSRARPATAAATAAAVRLTP
jgi:hypothetical protein